MRAHPDLADALRAEIAGFEALNRVLEAEHDALLGADADRLLLLSQDKARAVERLGELARERAHALQAHALDPRATDFRTRLAAQSPALAALWGRLEASAGQAQQHNLGNGDLLSARMAHNRAALHTLNAFARRHSVYGPDGQNVIPPAQRILGQA